MKYRNSDFLHENLFLAETPETARQAYNKLVCLLEHEQRRDPLANMFYCRPLSKRRERLTRMYWAFVQLESVEG